MNAIPSNTMPEARGHAENSDDDVDGREGVREASAPFALLCIPSDLQHEIFHLLGAQDITRLACVSVGMRDALRQHPVIRAFSQLGTPSQYASLVGGLEAIQSTTLSCRSTLMREYASRMVRMEDGDGAIPWLYYVRLCGSQLRADGEGADHGEALYDLCVVQSVAMLRILNHPAEPHNPPYKWENALASQPVQYRVEMIDALLGLHAGMSCAERQVWAFVDQGGCAQNRVPLRFIAVMAALQLFDIQARDVCDRFAARFALTSEQISASLQPIVVEVLSRCFPRRCVDLSSILRRWNGNGTALRSALHDALIQKAMEAMRDPLREIPDHAMSLLRPMLNMQATERVLAIPSQALADLDAVYSVMPMFWTVYFMSGRQCGAAWRSVMQMPWQVQPTLLVRLVCRSGLAIADVDDFWEGQGNLALWEQTMFARCKANDLPRLAVRALMVGIAFSCRQSHEEKSAVLQCALTLARDNTPSWSWDELIEALCERRAEAERIPLPGWPSDADVGQWMTAFLSDADACTEAPSPVFVAALVRHAKSVWQHLPDGEDAEALRFEHLCDRLKYLQGCRRNLRTPLIRCFTSGAFDIG